MTLTRHKAKVNSREFDPIQSALEKALLINQLVMTCRSKAAKANKPIKAAAIARRAKDLPNLIASAGLAAALTFYMAKSEGEEIYRKLYNYVTGREELSKLAPLCTSEDREKGPLVKEIEENGYTTLLALAAAAISDIEGQELSSYNTLAMELKQLRESGIKEFLVEKKLLEYLVEIKKLAEAFFGEEE